MTPLSASLNKITRLSPESETLFVKAWERWSVPKDHQLVRQYSVCDHIYFLESGAVRIYYHKNGKEVTEWLALENQFFLSLTSFYLRAPSNLTIHTLEPSIVHGIRHDDLMNLADDLPDVGKLLRNMMTGGFIMSQQRMESMHFESARERYENLLRQSPEIIQRVPLSHIASFLGITMETLSRVRARK
jgi:CRP-like cAMP-binding protein